MSYNNEFQRWISSDLLTKEEKEELFSIQNDEKVKAMRFSTPIDFGTAGLRATMNMGLWKR